MLPALAAASALRSEPGPESAVLVTVIVAAEAPAAASSIPAPATKSSVAAFSQTPCARRLSPTVSLLIG